MSESTFDVVQSIKALEDEIELHKNMLGGQLCELACALEDVGLLRVDGDAFTREIEGMGDEDGNDLGIVTVGLTLRANGRAD